MNEKKNRRKIKYDWISLLRLNMNEWQQKERLRIEILVVCMVCDHVLCNHAESGSKWEDRCI